MQLIQHLKIRHFPVLLPFQRFTNFKTRESEWLYQRASSFFTFGMPIKFLKSNLNWNAGFELCKTTGFD